jgi:RNA polymerase sigma-70 factor (ECF subfamily)
MATDAAHFPDAVVCTVRVSGESTSSSESSNPNLDPAASLSQPVQGLAESVHLPEGSDELLLTEISRGSKEALSILFRRYARTVRILAERILRDPAEAEDLVQEVFLFVFRKAALFDPARGSARSWLVQVAYHRAFDRRRYLASRRHHTNLAIDEGMLETDESAALPNSYEQTIEAALGRQALSRIEESLSEAQRRVLSLHFVEGYSFEEIAQILGQSAGNVRNHYYRALEKIRREIFTPKLQGQ